MKSLGRLFWIVIAVIAVVAGYREFGRSNDAYKSDPQPRVGVVNMDDYSPRCLNARGEAVEFQPRQHKVFAEQKLSGLTAPQDDKTILYDHDELSKVPAEYRDFVLRAACARNANVDPREAECVAIKRLRDEKSLPKEKVALIAERLPASVGTDDKDARVRNLTSCFDARN